MGDRLVPAVAVLLLTSLAVSAQEPPAPAAPAGGIAERCARVQEVLARVRGLPWRSPVRADVVTLEELRTLLAEEIRREYGEEGLAGEEKVLRALGLIPEGLSMDALYRDAMAPQIMGLYLPSQDRFVMVDIWASMAGLILPHELEHAMQDQHFDLERISTMSEENADRAAVLHIVCEGEAQFVAERCAGDLVGAGEREAPDPADLMRSVVASLASAGCPDFMQEDGLIAYLGGHAFVAEVHRRGGWEAVDRLLSDPPPSTEQILHPEKFWAGESPVEVALPEGLDALLGDGWKRLEHNVLGEQATRAVVRAWTGDVAAGLRVAAGWGGDRYIVWEGPDGALALVWCSEWDSEADAAEAADALGSRAQVAVARGRRVALARGIPAGARLALEASLAAWASGGVGP